MPFYRNTFPGVRLVLDSFERTRGALSYPVLLQIASLLMALTIWPRAGAQVNVLTQHNDIARTGQNLNETVLTPSNVNSSQFGRLFSQHVTGRLYAQPLYVSQVAIPNKGIHNVVYVATTSDQVYAFDADTNGGTNARPLWTDVLLNNIAGGGTVNYNFGVDGTPVIDLATNTMYLVSSESQILPNTTKTTYIARLHAIDITSGAEKEGGPVLIQATIPSTGTGSVNGSLTFDPHIHQQRPGLLLLNGVVYVGFGSDGADDGSWHGWIFSFNEATLQQLNVFCVTPNGGGGGIWMGGAGLAAEVNNPAKPYGRMFVATGNGTFAASYPYNNSMSYGMSMLDLDLTGGQITVEDAFTPYNEAALNGQDGDFASGGPVLLPTQTLASGTTLNPLIQIAKSGMIYLLDRDNNTDGSNNSATEYSPAGLGGFNAAGDKVVQEIQTPQTSGSNWGAGVWGTEAYWNNTIYSGGTNPSAGTGITYSMYAGTGNSLTAYSYTNGVLSTTPTSQSVEQFVFPGPTPAISANGTTNGIVWVTNNAAVNTNGPEILLAYDATNLGHTLYSSNTNAAQDTPGIATEFMVPIIANGKVYVGAKGQVSVYGLLGLTPVAPSPVITSVPGQSVGTLTINITDSLPGTTIYYTTDGSAPQYYSSVYSITNPPVISATTTITAVASINGYQQSAPASATFTVTTATNNPVFSLAGGTYTGTQTLTITDSSPNATIYYTIDGSAPTTTSQIYSSALTLSVTASEIVQAIAVSPGLGSSAVVGATYTVQPAYAINYPAGFTLANGPIQFNGSSDLDDYRLQLTNGGLNEAGSAFYGTPVNIQSFTTDFGFQLSNPAGNGITFTIQNQGAGALGSSGAGLGYATIANSIAVKFDLYNSAGEGPDSTGLYINGAMPTVPAVNLTGTGIDLHSGDNISAHITYDGTNLTITLTDTLTLATWSASWPVNIPSIVGGSTAYVGFTGGTGTNTASQKLTFWTYLAGPLSAPNYPAGFDGVGMTMNGATTVNGTKVRLTDGSANETSSAFFTVPANIQQFSTNFDFQLSNSNGEGITFAIQGIGPTSIGAGGASLGYGSIGNSLAVKFDLFNDAGEGSDSTGLYTAGAVPAIPSTDLSSTGINLHSGDTFNAQLDYNGTALTVTITDLATGAAASQTYTVDIPAIVGGTTAYVGFTGSTSASTAIQDVVNWTYSTTYVAPASLGATAPLITGLSANYGASNAVITLSGTNFGASQGASAVSFNGSLATATAWSNTTILVSVPSAATTGNLVVSVGSLTSNGVPFTVEPTPTVANISPSSGPPGTIVTIIGQNMLDAGGSGIVAFNGIFAPILSPSNTSIQVAIPSGASTGTFDVHANGVDSYSSPFTVTAATVPQISTTSANYGAPFATIGLTGNNFGTTQGTSTVTFNGLVATIKSWSNTAISVSVPYRATTGNLVATVGGQSSNAVPFTVELTPSLTGMSPTSGPAGTLVTITGQNLLDAGGLGQVWFGGLSLPILNPTNTSLQVAIPAGAVTGTILVHINGIGMYTSTFTVVAASTPQISSLSSVYGADYSTVILTGTNFGASQGASTVTFNGAVATAKTWSNTSITVTVPFHGSTGNVVVSVSGQASNGVPFTVEPSPVITGISPASGPPGTVVTISGQNLVDAGGLGQVWFSSLSLPIVNPSSTSIQVTVPAGAASGTFLLHTNGVGTYSPTFTVNAATVPQISSLSANYGADYATITITGANFGSTQGASTVTFNGAVATAMAWSNTTLSVSVPFHGSTGNVVVTVAGQSSNGVFFTVEPTPSITGMTPTSGPPGTVITITGTNLIDGEGLGQVWLGSRSLPILNPSNTSIQVVVPTGGVTGAIDVHTNGVGKYTPTFTVTTH